MVQEKQLLLSNVNVNKWTLKYIFFLYKLSTSIFSVREDVKFDTIQLRQQQQLKNWPTVVNLPPRIQASFVNKQFLHVVTLWYLKYIKKDMFLHQSKQPDIREELNKIGAQIIRIFIASSVTALFLGY